MPDTIGYYALGGVLEKLVGLIGWGILIGLILLAIKIVIAIVIIKAICKYMARKNAEEFKYDYLATKVAEETCKRMMIIEKNKKESQTIGNKEE